MSSEYPALYLEGLRLFNAEDFFESHEVLEELWAETEDDDKKFYQGLIQAAVSLLHFGNENLGGAHKVYTSARKYLLPYAPTHQGLDVERLLAELDHCFAELVASPDPYGQQIVLRDERIPKISLPNSAG